MSMSERFDKLFERMKLEFKKQTMDLTYSLTRNLSVKLEEKIKPLKQENQALKSEIEFLEKKIAYLERDNKRNNIIIFGFEEKETCVKELLEAVRKKMVNDLKISVLLCDINNVYRVGKRKNDTTKPRAVVVTFLQTWKRNEVLRNKKKFRNIFVSEDFPKDVLEKRKLWLEELKEERKKGKIAYLVYDKLLVKPGMQNNVKKEQFVNNVNKGEDLTELLDSLEQEEEKKPRRRAKAMINRDKYKMLSDEEKPQSRAKSNTNTENISSDEEKPRRRAKAVINKNNSLFDTESEDDKAAKKSTSKAKAKATNNVSFLDGESEEDDQKLRQPRPRKPTGKNNVSRKASDEEFEDDKAAEKSTRKVNAKATNNISFLDGESEEDDQKPRAPRPRKPTDKKKLSRKESDEEFEDEKPKNEPTPSTSKNEDVTEFYPQKRKIDY